ncbi:MAG: U32 family peptidase [Clostridia bacterium]
MKLPELLAPAGNMERLTTALRFGADAVYVGAQSMSLRNFADNFTAEGLTDACAMAHELGKRVYVACNAFARDDDMDMLPELMQVIGESGADALIVNDPGVIRTAKRLLPDMPLHLSTQANTLNSEAVMFWRDMGVRRVILARELSIAQIARIRERVPLDVELEMFVHGAMCISYSGRCLLSNYFSGRDCYKGECAQPCRWAYELRERGSNGEYYTIEQDALGTFVMNSRDLNLIEHLKEVVDAGVCSLKIEGRMKSIAYVATVTNAYRMALNALERGESVQAIVVDELNKASHRPYTTGFAFGNPGQDGQRTHCGGYVADQLISAVVCEYDAKKQEARVIQRNRFFDGEELSILSPSDVGRCFTLNGIRDMEGNAQSAAPHPQQELIIGCSQPLKPGDILKKDNLT